MKVSGICYQSDLRGTYDMHTHHAYSVFFSLSAFVLLLQSDTPVITYDNSEPVCEIKKEGFFANQCALSR